MLWLLEANIRIMGCVFLKPSGNELTRMAAARANARAERCAGSILPAGDLSTLMTDPRQRQVKPEQMGTAAAVAGLSAALRPVIRVRAWRSYQGEGAPFRMTKFFPSSANCTSLFRDRDFPVPRAREISPCTMFDWAFRQSWAASEPKERRKFPVNSLFPAAVSGDGFARDCVHHHQNKGFPAAGLRPSLPLGPF